MDYLPSVEKGWLPLYVFLVGLTALGNVVQCYTTLSYTRRIYTGTIPGAGTKIPLEKSSPVTHLSARTFGTWNMAVAIARLYASYNLTQASWFQMSMWTNIVGLLHFGSEAFIFKTCKPSGPWLAPTGVASIGLIWHVLQYDYYTSQ